MDERGRDRPEDELTYWRDCGADRYLLKIETFDEALYARCRPGLTVADRLDRLEALRRAGGGVWVGRSIRSGQLAGAANASPLWAILSS